MALLVYKIDSVDVAESNPSSSTLHDLRSTSKQPKNEHHIQIAIRIPKPIMLRNAFCISSCQIVESNQ